MSVTVTYISAFTEKKTAEWGGHSHGFDSRYEYEVPSINEFNHLNKTCSEMQKCISENSSELRQVQKKQTDDLNKLSKEFVNIKNREQEFEESIKTFVEQQLSEGSPFFSFFSQVIQAHIENVQKRTDEIKTVSKEIFALREDIANKISLCKNDIRQNEEKHTIFFQELKAEGKQLTASRNTAEKEIKEWTKCIRQSVEQAQNDFEKIQQRQQELKQNTDVIAEQLHVSQKTSELLQAYEERIKKLEAIVVELKTNRKQTQSVLLAQEKAESVLQISVKAGVASNEPLQINKTIKSNEK